MKSGLPELLEGFGASQALRSSAKIKGAFPLFKRPESGLRGSHHKSRCGRPGPSRLCDLSYRVAVYWILAHREPLCSQSPTGRGRISRKKGGIRLLRGVIFFSIRKAGKLPKHDSGALGEMGGSQVRRLMNGSVASDTRAAARSATALMKRAKGVGWRPRVLRYARLG